VEKREAADKNKEIAGVAIRSVKFTKGFSIIIIFSTYVLKFSPGSAIRCFFCFGVDCRAPYTRNISHEVTCLEGWNFCVKVDLLHSK
jgi:hypothetical protein